MQGSNVNFAVRTSLSLLTAASLWASEARYAEAQEGARRLSGEVVLVTPDGEVLDFVPEASEVRQMRDSRGRTVLVDNYGNLVATVMPADAYFNGVQQREQALNNDFGSDGFGNDGFDASDPGAVTGSIPEFGDVVPQDVEREALPDANDMPAIEGDDFASIDPNETAPSTKQVLPPAQTVTKKSSGEIVALQVYLDREGFSPGVIDGKMGSNVTKSIEAWQLSTGQTLDPNNTDDILERLRLSGGLPITSYTITAADAAGPYVASIPEDYAHKAMLPALSYTSTTENLAERFHMDETYLKELNPGADFTIPGTIIKVINPGENRTGSVARIVADKARKQVFAYDAAGKLIAAYPATIGSSDTPSPSGIVSVERIALNPGYTYNPKINFKQGTNDKVLTLQPGPNGPVGTVWIALSKPTYGIHGTPEPSKIGKTQSHGCIRLTNWDATELAKMVTKGVTVEFVD
ncbi:L,D-transpeptidase family protein [Pararhizobium sp.]|uniref:L,D-transpeptidase family protein n=1 Tax=Pararhizobium sp. TaxID=1977563 RepID=UPI0027185C87|nr:L,D-transpeptidase [Pararhizobium sp.]MDO9414599.1 L,D-transpeptidase [Pararhizobium sp.]